MADRGSPTALAGFLNEATFALSRANTDRSNAGDAESVEEIKELQLHLSRLKARAGQRGLLVRGAA